MRSTSLISNVGSTKNLLFRICSRHEALSTLQNKSHGRINYPLQRRKDELMDATLSYVKQHGWNRTNFNLAASSLGYCSSYTSNFTLYGLTEYLFEEFSDRLELEVAPINTTLHSIHFLARVELLLNMFLSYFEDFQPYWHEAIETRDSVDSKFPSLKLGLKVADVILSLSKCGEHQSFKLWESNRLMIAAIFLSCERILVTDGSPGLYITQEFVRGTFKKLEKASIGINFMNASLWSISSIIPSFF